MVNNHQKRFFLVRAKLALIKRFRKLDFTKGHFASSCQNKKNLNI